MKRYNPSEIEPKWQKIWDEQKTYEVQADDTKHKSYVTAMFPYPSGAGLHVGHVRNYSITDAIARFERAKGKNVLSAMGWDAFGLPAENYAIKTGTPPAESTAQNIVNFKRQLKRLGLSYDWSREFNTTDPSYYRWTQWLFTKFFEHGLAYQKESQQWWCPICKTVLANEQVINGGYCWRHEDTLVEKKWLKQWFFKITDYADDLLDGLDDLGWPEKIKAMQRNWIGKSKGALIRFSSENAEKTIEVFTTRPDTIYGATFLVLAPEHPFVTDIVTAEQKQAVEAYVREAQKKSDVDRMNESREKTGVFTGAYAINPATKERIPIWTADYVLMGYGTGAIMAVPAHDRRDYEFARKFDLSVKEVVAVEYVYTDKNAPRDGVETLNRRVVDAIIRNDKGQYLLLVEPDNIHFVGGGVEEGEDAIEALKREVTEESGYTDIGEIKEVSSTILAHGYRFTKDKNQIGIGKFYEVTLSSDSRIDSEVEQGSHSIKWVDKDEVGQMLTWQAHRIAWDQYVSGNACFAGDGVLINSSEYDGQNSAEARERIVADLARRGVAEEKTNYRMRDWLISRQRYWGAPIPIIHCEKDGAVAVPEDQLPVELPPVENYEPKGDGKSVLAHVPDWYNVTCPKCGGPAVRETDTLDGYVCSSWYLLRYTDAQNDRAAWDPAKANYWAPVDFYCGGDHAVAHLLYVRFWTRFFKKIGLVDFEEPVKRLVYNGYINAADGSKMSKSKGNVVDPLELIDQGYGADALRVYELFIGPYEQDAAWDPKGIAGTYRFLNRAWTLTQEFIASNEQGPPADKALTVAVHRSIKRVTEDLERQSFNTAIAALMEYVNDLYRIKTAGFGDRGAWMQALTVLSQLLQPFAPHIAEELWQELGHTGSVHAGGWPEWDENYLVTDTITVVVQINGKVRAQLQLPADVTEAAAIEAARAEEKVSSYLTVEPKKTVYVPGRLVSFVV